jgi:sugar lactone lactonase YvrE
VDHGTDISANEQNSNPDGGLLDSNPYGILESGRGYLVADAGANALVSVDPNHKTSTVAVFPNLATTPPRQAVPTSVVLGPDGAYYVGLLTGAPFAVGLAEVLRVVPGQAPTVAVSGLTNVVDIAFRPQDGRLYVLEIAANAIPNFGTGTLLRIEANGDKTPIGPSLFAPGGLAFGPDGAAYVSVNSILPGTGQVMRIPIP